jgi:glycosyltransferase involved in cell wall biosynthesis
MGLPSNADVVKAEVLTQQHETYPAAAAEALHTVSHIPFKAHVVIIQEQLKQYRLPLFTQLTAALAAEHIQLTVLYSQPNRQEAQKADHRQVNAPWSHAIPITHWHNLTWQRLPFSQLRQADLVIIEQANRHMANWCCWLGYRLKIMTGTWFRWPNVAFWGHGQDFQRPYVRWRDQLKQRLIATVHWWFAYTPHVAQAIAAQGMPSHKIVALTNTVDSDPLHTAVKSLRQAPDQSMAAPYSAKAPGFRLLFCGALYEHKRLDLLFAAADLLVAEHIPVELTLIGAGPLQTWCQQMCASRSYATYIGALFADGGSEPDPHDVRDHHSYTHDAQQHDPRAPYFAKADLLVIPGLVGLAVVDGFAADLPLITTDVPYHSPEICYLRAGYNGIMCKPDAVELAATLRQLWQSPAQLALLRQGAHASYPQLQLPVLVNQFSRGIIAALADAKDAAATTSAADKTGTGKSQ